VDSRIGTNISENFLPPSSGNSRGFILDLSYRQQAPSAYWYRHTTLISMSTTVICFLCLVQRLTEMWSTVTWYKITVAGSADVVWGCSAGYDGTQGSTETREWSNLTRLSGEPYSAGFVPVLFNFTCAISWETHNNIVNNHTHTHTHTQITSSPELISNQVNFIGLLEVIWDFSLQHLMNVSCRK